MWTEEKGVTLTFKFPRPQSDQASVDCARIIYLICDSSINGYKMFLLLVVVVVVDVVVAVVIIVFALVALVVVINEQ